MNKVYELKSLLSTPAAQQEMAACTRAVLDLYKHDMPSEEKNQNILACMNASHARLQPYFEHDFVFFIEAVKESVWAENKGGEVENIELPMTWVFELVENDTGASIVMFWHNGKTYLQDKDGNEIGKD
jgi:hypothetical protein